MIEKYKLILATLVAAILFASGSATAFQGFSIGVIGNYATFDTSGTEKEGNRNNSPDINTGSISTDVDFGSMFVEYTMGETFGATIGIEHVPGDATIGTKTRADTVSDSDESSTDTGTYTGKAEISDYYMFYVEPTLMANVETGGFNFGVYAKGGVNRITVRTLESIAIGTDSSTYGNEDVWGVTYGFGVKGVHSSGLFFKLEGIQTEYGKVTFNSTTGNKNLITADPESTAGRIAIGYNF